jgi:hypothetical protein
VIRADWVVCFEEVTDDEVMSGFPRDFMTSLSFFKDSQANVTSDPRWHKPVVQLENTPSKKKRQTRRTRKILKIGL